MLTFSRLGQIGRLGNQLFQVAFLTSFAQKYSCQYVLPYWQYEDFFEYNFEFSDELDKLPYDLVIREPGLGYHENYFINYLPIIRSCYVNIITGYFQSYKYFDKLHVLKIFKFKKDFTLNANKCIAISVRRGDFLEHRDYNIINAEIFRQELSKFPNYKVFVFTDDYKYCRGEFIGSRYEFLDGFNDIQQLHLMSKFEHFILSNSTFSYWGPMLNPAPKYVSYPEFMFPDLQRCKLFNDEFWPKDKVYRAYRNPINKP